MSTAQKIAKNTFLLVFTNFVSLGIGLIMNIYIAIYLGDTSFGIISAALNLATLFTLMTDLGVSTFLTMELSRRPEQVRRYLNNAISVKLILISIAYAGIIISAYIGHFTGTKLLVVYVIGLYVMLTALSQLFQATFQAFQTIEHIAVCQIINPVILIVGALYVIASGMDVVAFALVYLVSGAAVLTYNIIIAFLSYSRPVPGFELGMWKALIIGGLPFSLSSLFYFLYFKIDIQLIDMIKGSAAVGNYSAAYKLIEAVLVLPSLYSMVIFPVVSEYFHKNNPNLKILLEKSIKYLLIIGAPIAVGTFILADKFIFFCYKGQYLPSIDVLQVLALGVMFIFLNTVPGVLLSATNGQKSYMVICFMAAVFNIIANIIVIPSYGIVGSAYTMAATQGVILVLLCYLFMKGGYRLPHVIDVIKIIACTLLMGMAVFFMRPYNLFVIVLLAIVIYLLLIVATRLLSGDDIELISTIFAKKKA